MIHLKNIIWKLPQKMKVFGFIGADHLRTKIIINNEILVKVFGFIGADHLRTKIIINNEILEQFSKFTYLGCSIS